MRARAIAVVAALGIAALVVPVGASARPGFYTQPGYRITTALLFGPSGRSLLVTAFHGQISLIAGRTVAEDGEETVTYARPIEGGSGDRLDLDLGRAGEVDLRFVTGERNRESSTGCSGGPVVTREGYFLGTVSFHPPGGFLDIHRHRLRGVVLHAPTQVCRGHQPRVRPGLPHGYRSLIAGSPDGDRRLEATAYPPIADGSPRPVSFRASVTRTEGRLTVIDAASASTAKTEPFRIPSLDALPATATVEPTAPFSGSATFALPSRQSAAASGDLAVELPEAGSVALTGPGIVAGACDDSGCTGSLPKALLPATGVGFTVSVGSVGSS